MTMGRTPGEGLSGPVRGLSIRKVQTPIGSEGKALPPPVRSEPRLFQSELLEYELNFFYRGERVKPSD